MRSSLGIPTPFGGCYDCSFLAGRGDSYSDSSLSEEEGADDSFIALSIFF